MTSPSEVAARAENLLAAWNARDLDAFVAQLAPQVYWHDLGMPYPPAIGRDAVRAFAEAVLHAFPDFRYTIRGAICVGTDATSCVVPFLITATNVNPLTPPGYAPTGRTVRIEGLDYLRFDAQYITSIETRFDVIATLEQLLGWSLRPPRGSGREAATVRLQRLLAWWVRRRDSRAHTAA